MTTLEADAFSSAATLARLWIAAHFCFATAFFAGGHELPSQRVQDAMEHWSFGIPRLLPVGLGISASFLHFQFSFSKLQSKRLDDAVKRAAPVIQQSLPQQN
jgi:hypothetical protein